MESIKRQQVEKRNLLSSFFVTLLIGLAYQEMIAAVRASVRTFGLKADTLLLMAIFFMTSMRFFVGNQLHLLSESLAAMPGLVWFYDLLVIIIQSVILIFLGGVSSAEINQGIHIGFVPLLIALYSIDVVWIASQYLLGKIFPSWRRRFIPWAWAVLNSVLILGIALLRMFIRSLYSIPGIVALFVLNLVAFIVDVILIDYYDAI